MKQGTELQNHVFDTYISLRYGMAALALGFPFVVPLAGWLHGTPIKDSLSEYFCEVSGAPESDGIFAARTIFVGILFALGAALYLYKGFSNRENYLLNVAGACAWLVALIPTPCGKTNTVRLGLTLHGPSLHGTAAVLLFVAVGLVCLFCSEETLDKMPPPTGRDWYERAYKVLGTLMLVLPLVVVFLTVISGQDGKRILAIEAAGSVVFGTYWLIKSVELSHSGAQKKATQGVV